MLCWQFFRSFKGFLRVFPLFGSRLNASRPWYEQASHRARRHGWLRRVLPYPFFVSPFWRNLFFPPSFLPKPFFPRLRTRRRLVYARLSCTVVSPSVCCEQSILLFCRIGSGFRRELFVKVVLTYVLDFLFNDPFFLLCTCHQVFVELARIPFQ